MAGLLRERIRLTSVEQVKEYIHMAETLTRDCNLLAGIYIVDGKSIMGIFSLDLSKTLTFEYDEIDYDIAKSIVQRFGV